MFLKVIGLLEADKSRNGWNLSRSPDGNYSLVINHFPANNQERSSEVQHRSMPVLNCNIRIPPLFLKYLPLRRRSRNQRPRGGGPGKGFSDGSRNETLEPNLTKRQCLNLLLASILPTLRSWKQLAVTITIT